MAAPTLYHQFKLKLGKKTLNLNADNIYICLYTSASNAMNAAASPADYSSFTNELATGNGYTHGGLNLGASNVSGSNPTILGGTGSPGLPALWSITGAGITWRAYVLFDASDNSAILYGFPNGNESSDTTFLAGDNYLYLAGFAGGSTYAGIT